MSQAEAFLIKLFLHEVLAHKVVEQGLAGWYDLMLFCKLMKTLRINLAGPLRERINGSSKREVAKAADISVPKLQKILADNWKYVDRRTLERVMNYLDLGVNEVFEFLPVTFWNSIKTAGSCVFLCGSPKATSELEIPGYAFKAAGLIREFLRGGIHASFIHNLNEEELFQTVRTKNCIVIGSPRINRTTEILLSRFYDAKPFDPTEENRRKVPFGFVWGQETPDTKNSSLGCTADKLALLQGRPGLAWRLREGPGLTSHEGAIKTDFKEPDKFRGWVTRDAVDAGLIFVADRPFQAIAPVKLIVLAGVSGIGTLAAAQALIRDCRDLQPLPNQNHVFGIVKAHYSKQNDESDGRNYKNYRWQFRKSGPAPIDESGSKTKKQSAKST
ncbi:MAG TPA: helix-turn-helix transcriptional regulator [Candidatus Angelobacter sp.]|nr:helix-turn-helix transcriptional regulator [Candidatus Angelobacter sp.]